MAEQHIHVTVEQPIITAVPRQESIQVALEGAASGWPFGDNPIRVELEPDTPTVVDAVAMPSRYRVVKWLFSISDEVGDFHVNSEITAFRKGDQVYFNQFGLMGDALNLIYETDVNAHGDAVELTITNRQPNPVTVRLTRLGIFH